MEIIERKSAIAHNLPTYYTGKLCKNGHLAYRYTACGTCAECKNGTPAVRIDPERQGLSERAKAMQDEQAQARTAAAESRARQQRGKEQALHFAKIITPIHARDWADHSQRILEIVQMTYPDVTREDIVPKKHINTVRNNMTFYNMMIPHELVDLECSMSQGLHKILVNEARARAIESEPGSMLKTVFEGMKTDESGHDEQWGYVVRIGQYWYNREPSWGPDAIVHPINQHWWRPRKHYSLFDVDVIKYTSEDDEADCLDLTGEFYNINGDWFHAEHVRAAKRNEMKSIKSCLVDAQLNTGA